LKLVLHKVIDDNIYASLEGRWLVDSVAVVNEVLDEVKRRRA